MKARERHQALEKDATFDPTSHLRDRQRWRKIERQILVSQRHDTRFATHYRTR